MCLKTSSGTGYPLTDSNVTAIWWLGTLLRVSVARNARGAERAFSHGASTCRICRTGTMPLPSIILRRCLPAFGSIATEACNILLRNRAHACRDFIFNESRCTENMVSENIGANLEGIAYQTARYETGWTADAQWTNNVAFRCKTGFFIHKSRRDWLRNNIVYDCSGYNVEAFRFRIRFRSSCVSRQFGIYTRKDEIVEIMRWGNVVTRVSDTSRWRRQSGDVPGFVSTTYGQENFTLREGSRAKGYGYGGVDLGAYSVYGAVPTGPEERNDPFAVQAGFNAYASCLERRAEMSFTVRLSCLSGRTTFGFAACGRRSAGRRRLHPFDRRNGFSSRRDCKRVLR